MIKGNHGNLINTTFQSYNHGADFFDYEILNLNNLGNLRYDINTHATHLRLHLLIENLPALHDGVNPVFSVYWK